MREHCVDQVRRGKPWSGRQQASGLGGDDVRPPSRCRHSASCILVRRSEQEQSPRPEYWGYQRTAGKGRIELFTTTPRLAAPWRIPKCCLREPRLLSKDNPHRTGLATSPRAPAPGEFALRNAAGSPPAPAGCRMRRGRRRGRGRRRCGGGRARRSERLISARARKR
jgi:hypothetical protein